MSHRTEKHFLTLSALLIVFSLLLARLQAVPLPALAETGQMTVILDAGHGGEDAGTIGINGALEKDLNLEMVNHLATLFRDAGVRVILTRDSDSMVLKEGEDVKGKRKECDLKNRLATAERYPDAVFVSIHMNAFPVEKYKGLEVHYSTNHSQSKRYAEKIMTRVKKELEPESNRTPKMAGENIYLLHHAKNPAILIECGFLSNREDAAKLADKDYQKQLSFCIFCAMMDIEQ